MTLGACSARLRGLRLRHEQAAAEAARHAAGSESLTELVAEARRKVAEARAARAAAAAAAEKLRKEKQRVRKVEETLGGAMARMEESAGARGVDAVEEAMQAAAKHAGYSEQVAALVAEAKGMVEQARAAEAERTRVAAEAAEAAAEAAVKRQQVVAELAALDLRTKQLQAELGSGSGTPQPNTEETMCVVCMDAPKDRIVLPCMHMCACGPCAQRLLELNASCPVCRGPVERMAQVFS
jgi:multidrug efflux pump subunit AcrA (membrane-fusion protein)